MFKTIASSWAGLRVEVKVAVIAIVVSAITSLITTLLTSWLASRRSRKQKLWELDVEKVQKIEALGNKINDQLNRLGHLDDQTIRYAIDLLADFGRKIGVLPHYKDLTQSMRDLQNAAQRVIDSSYHNEDLRPDQKDLNDTYTKLSSICKKITDGKTK